MCHQIRIQAIGALLKIQAIMLVLIVLSFLWNGVGTAISCFYGGIIGMANTFLQGRCLFNSVKWDKLNATVNLRKTYLCFVEKWVVTIFMFTVGFAVFKFFPLPLITGYIVIQLALLFWKKIRL